MRIEKTNSRYTELDIARGIATLVMISYHFCWDINYFVRNFELPYVVWEYTSYAIASSFLLIVGISSYIEFKKSPTEEKKRKFTKKILRTLLAASAVTVSSLFFMSDRPIYFGILHCIVVSYLLVGFFMRRSNKLTLATAVLFIVVGIYFYTKPFRGLPLFWLIQSNFKVVMSDYLPLMPWFGIILLGTLLGKKIAPALESRNKSINKESSLMTKSLTFIGQHTLIIYLLHQPIMMGVLQLLGYKNQ